MTAGRRSTMPFHTRRADSYSRSPGQINLPTKASSSVPTAVSSSTAHPERGHRIDRNRGGSGHQGEGTAATSPRAGRRRVALRVPSALDRVLEARAGREARSLGGGDLHRLARGRVGALAGVAMGDGELAEARDGDVLAGGQAFLDGGDG